MTALAIWGDAMGDNAIGISENRIRHMLQVGRTAETLASELFDWPEDKCRAMFLLGYLHDAGYEYAREQSEHPEIAGLMLKKAGYEYWREVRWHGVPSPPYKSDELLILNIADNITDGAGNTVTVQDRLHDIEARYGSDSSQLQDAIRLTKETSTELVARALSSATLDAKWWASDSGQP